MKVYTIEINAYHIDETHVTNAFFNKDDAKHVLTFFGDEKTPIFVDPMYVLWGNRWYDEYLKDEFEILSDEDKLIKFKNLSKNWNYDDPQYSDAVILCLLQLSIEFNWLKNERVIFDILELNVY